MSARLSPAASLLRSSKLFALPPTIALPAAPPSSDQVSNSETATTVYPRYAAIQTTSTSGSQGDWGFKRPLPLKATRSTNNPVVRLVRGIDTPEHIADYESAADHVLTLRKFQELNLSLRHPEKAGDTSSSYSARDFNVFRPTHDNTTNPSSSSPASSGPLGIWPEVKSEDVYNQLPEQIKQQQRAIDEQKEAQDLAAGVDPANSGAAQLMSATSRRGVRERRRWRYAGPSLFQLSGMEFDEYLNKLGKKEQDMLTDRIKREITQSKLVRARDQGKMDQQPREEDVTEREVKHYLRYLRNEPRRFGAIIADMLDLPENNLRPQGGRAKADEFEYGRDTLAAADWQERGPPRTHPSAGLSYVHTVAHAHNDPIYGPQKENSAVLARAVKTATRAGKTEANFGVAGFIVPTPQNQSSTRATVDAFTPQPGGQKRPVQLGAAYINEEGALILRTRTTNEYEARGDEAVSKQQIARENAEKMQEEADEARERPAVAPQFSSLDDYQPRPSRRLQDPEYLARHQIRKEPSGSGQDPGDVLGALFRN
ncbi:hypothetical protein LTR70_000316 [Exophiala xenobiotica]|uniref:Uncharacterized protein n=1 Tax=Lithohypha guttulata TaxID=1690604 RepID=A0ABR0KPJ5_9EURO|nr:hypothetical protein LTR24_000019 [Lithohypha guttulata]KAK5330486.1 hypothetical protein LTR70_000316 [Exophiala xenobiotica]